MPKRIWVFQECQYGSEVRALLPDAEGMPVETRVRSRLSFSLTPPGETCHGIRIIGDVEIDWVDMVLEDKQITAEYFVHWLNRRKSSHNPEHILSDIPECLRYLKERATVCQAGATQEASIAERSAAV